MYAVCDYSSYQHRKTVESCSRAYCGSSARALKRSRSQRIPVKAPKGDQITKWLWKPRRGKSHGEVPAEQIPAEDPDQIRAQFLVDRFEVPPGIVPVVDVGCSGGDGILGKAVAERLIHHHPVGADKDLGHNVPVSG